MIDTSKTWNATTNNNYQNKPGNTVLVEGMVGLLNNYEYYLRVYHIYLL